MRLLVVTDWDAGFCLRPSPPLLDVDPGDNYVTEVVPAKVIAIHEILVECFQLAEVSVGGRTAHGTAVTAGQRRIYKLDAPLIVDSQTSCRLLFCNDTQAPLKPKDVTIVRYDPMVSTVVVGVSQSVPPSKRLNIERPADDRVREHEYLIEVENRCGLCGQIFKMEPGDPHKELIDMAFKNEGRGPLCPDEAAR